MHLSLGFFFGKIGQSNNNYISHLLKPGIRRDLMGTCLKERGEARLVSSGFIKDVKYNLIGRKKTHTYHLAFSP